MATNIYEPGDIVWVKLSNSWWPGEVWDPTQIPDDLSSLKKEPIAVVKFFKEDSYEYVKNSTFIYEYNCHRKKDFIKKGLELHRTSNNSFSQKFRDDIVRAERLTGGDINILENNDKKSSVSKRSNIVKMIFGDQTSSNQKKFQQQPNKSQNTNIIEKSPTIISKLKGRSIVTVKNIIKPSTPTASSTNSSPQKPNNSNPSTPSNGTYRCHLCPFTSMRQNVIILHSKSHLNQSGSSLNSTISPRLASENSRFSIPMPISNISKDSSVIVIDDDSDSDILSRTQTPQTVVTTIDTSSDSQIIDVSLSPQESSSSSSSGIKTIAAQKILPSRTNIVGSDKKKKNRGNKGVNNFYVSTPIKTSNINEVAENNEVNKTKADHIPLIKPPKKQFRKGILKDIYEDWSDEDSTPNNVKETANKDDADECPNNEVIQNNKNLFEALGCSRLDESDVEVLKNLQHAERNDKGKSPVTTQKIRNIPKKDRQRNIVLEDFSDSSSNVTPNQNIMLENREILPSSTVPLNVEKLDNANNTNLVNIEKIEENENTKLVQEAEKVMADNDNNSSELECKTDNLNEPTVISFQNESTACEEPSEEPSESQNEVCEEPNYSVTLDVNISKNDEIIDKESNKENVIDEHVEEGVKNNIDNIQTILPETSTFNEKDNLHICNVVIEKCSENDLIESPEFEPIDDAQKTTLSTTESKESEESILIDKENQNMQAEEYSTEINDEKNVDSLVTKESYLKESTNITDYEICKISDQTQLGNDEEIIQNLNEESTILESSKDLVTLKEKENFLNKEIIIDRSKESTLNNVDKISFENDNIEENISEVVENVNEELLKEKTLENIEIDSEIDKTHDNTCEELNVNISEDKSSEMQKPHGRSKRSVAQASKTIGHKIRKSSRKSDNIYKYLGREITTPSPIVTSESPIYTKLETSLGDLNESCNTTISIQFTENPSESNKELISSNEKEKLINEDRELNVETNIKNHDEDNIEKIDKDIEEKINRKNRKKQKVDTVEKKQTLDSDKFIEFLENEIKTTPGKISILENLKENINEVVEQQKSGIETENTFVQEKPVGRTLRERKIRKEYAELDEDSLSMEEKFQKQITDVENNSNLENKFEKSKEVDGSNSQTKISIKLKKSLLKHNKPCKSLISEPKTSTLQEEREVIPKLIIKSSKESGKEVTLKVMTVTNQRPQNENITITEQSPSESETKTIIEKQSPKSPKKSPKKSYIKHKPNDRKLFKKESPEKQKCEKTYKEDTPAAVFDFQEEDDTELVLTSLSKLKKKYLSPDKIKEPVILPDIEKQKEIEKNDEKLKAEIENLLNDTKITDVSLTKGSEKNIESIPNNNNLPNSNLNDEVKALPIKERGKRFFKSRNVSRNDDSQSHSSVCISGTSSSEKSNVIELVNSNVESENLKNENVFEIPKTEDPKSKDKILKENKRKQFKTLEETKTSLKICEKNSEKIDYSNSHNIDENIKSNSSSMTQEIICNNTNKTEQIIEKINSLSKENAENPSDIDLEISKDINEMSFEKSEANQGQNQDSALLEGQNQDSALLEGQNQDSALLEIKSDNSNNLKHEIVQKSHLFEVPKTDSNVMSQDENIILLPEIKTELIEPEVVIQDEKISDIKLSATIQSNEKTTQINSSLLSGNNIVRRRRSHLKVTPRKRNIPEGSVVNETSLEESQSKIAKFVEIPIDQSNTSVTDEKSSLTTLPTDETNVNQQESLHQDQFQELGKHLEVKNSDNKIKQFLQETVDFQSPVNEENNENLLSQENNKNESIKVKDFETVECKEKELCEPIPKVSNVEKSIVNETSSNKLQKEAVEEDHAKPKSNDDESPNQESLMLLTKNLKENHLSQDFEEQKVKEISNSSNESLTKTKSSMSNERKREKSITEQYEENFVEKYMKDAGISNLSSPNPQTKLENTSDLDNIVLDSGLSFNSNENKDQKLEINAKSLNDINEKTKEIEKVEILSHTQEKTNILNTYEIPLIEQAKAIVAKVPSTQSLSDIRSFRPKRKRSSRQSSISTSENIITTDILSPQSPTVLSTKRSHKKHLLEEKDIENKNVNNVNEETILSCTESENNMCDNENKIPTCPDFKILEAVDKLAEVQQSEKSLQTSSTPSGNARITVDSVNRLSVQISNILASNSDFKTPTETEIESKSILNICPNESILNKKRKLSFEEDIPTFIIDKTAALNTLSDKSKESSIKQQLIKNTNEGNKIVIANNSLEEKEKNLLQHGFISNIEEIVSEETPSACLKIKDSSQSSNENLSSSNTLSTTTSDTATTENVFDISNLPILLTTNEEILHDNIQFVIAEESTLIHEDQQDTAIQTISATTLQETVTEQIIIPTAKKIRGRPRKSDPSLPQPTTSIVTGYNQTSTNSVASPKLLAKTTQQISLNQKTNSNQKGLVKKTQQNITSPTLSQATVENSNQTYNVKATSSREIGVDASGNSIVLIHYGRNNQSLMKIPKTPTEQLQTTTSMDITHAKEQISKTSDKSQKPVQQLQNQTQKPQHQLQTKNVSHHRSGQVILSNKGTIVQTTENISQPTNISQSGSTYLNIGNKPASSNEVIITPIYESGNVAPKSNQQQLPQVQQPPIPQNNKAKKSHIQRTTYVGSENSEIIIRQIQQQQHEQQQQKHQQTTSSSTQRGRKRKELEPPNTAPNPNVNTPQRNKQQKLYQSNTNKIPTHNQTATSSSTLSYDNSKTQMSTQIDSTPSAINNQPKSQQQSVQQQQHHLQQQQQQQQQLLQQHQQQQQQQNSQQTQQQQQNSQQTQQQQQQQLQQSKSMIEEEIAANKIMAVPANHFGIPGSAYYLCSQDNEGNYMPIDNQELYLDPESNQLVPLSVLNAKTTAAVVAAAAAQTSTGLIDGNQQLNLIEANTDDGTSICMEINDSNKQHENTSDNNNIASTENVEAQQFIQTNNLAELSNILGPDQSICINIDGQQLILDQQSFLALVAAGGENTQLETQDGQILQLTSEFLAALGIGVSNNDNVSSESGAGVSNGGDENSSGTGEQQIILQTSNDEMATNTDILASALIDDVLQIETSQGVQLVNAVNAGVVSEETLGPAFQPLTPPVTAQTSETNALLTQPPIMSTLEVPSNKKKQSSKQLDTNAILLNTITGTTACGNNVINNNTLGSNRNNANINNNSNINCSERILATPQNLEDCIAFIGVSTQSSTVPSSLELPITVTNPAIAPPKTSAPLGGIFNTKNLIVESSQISPQMVSSISSDPELQLELFTTSSASSSSIGNNSSNNINNNNIIKGNRNNNRNNNDGNVGDNVVACNIEIEKFNENSKQQDVECAESGLNDFTNQSTIGSLSFEDPNR